MREAFWGFVLAIRDAQQRVCAMIADCLIATWEPGMQYYNDPATNRVGLLAKVRFESTSHGEFLLWSGNLCSQQAGVHLVNLFWSFSSHRGAIWWRRCWELRNATC